LELIMTEKKTLTADDARALLSDHVEGTLDADVRADVDALLAVDPDLAAERRRLQQTLTLLGGLPAPEGPADLVGRVRDRLAAERRAQGGMPAAPAAEVLPMVTRRWGGFEVALGLAAAAGIVVVLGVFGPQVGKSEGPSGTAAAGFAGDGEVVSATIVAPGFPRWLVVEHASRAGMDTVVGDTYEGDRRAAARFVFSLKETAAKRGVEISGFLPDAERLRVEVKAAP
jgi:anti-sigma factor RsiW